MTKLTGFKIPMCSAYCSPAVVRRKGKLLKCIKKGSLISFAGVNHRATVLLPNVLDAHRITVRCGSIFDDTLFALKGGIDDNKHIRVRFLGKLITPSKLFLLKSSRASYRSGRPQERVLYDFDERHFKQQFTSGRTSQL